MTTLRVWLLVMLVGWLPLHADILANGNFADGRTHWRGDIREVDPSLGGAPSIFIDLKKDKWTKLYQTFPCRDKRLYYRITFQLSPDYKMAPNDGKAAMSQPDLSNVPGVQGDMSFMECFWGLAIFSSDTSFGRGGGVTINATKFDQQTSTGDFYAPAGTDATMVLLFPPGQGSVQLCSINLSADAPAK